ILLTAAKNKIPVIEFTPLQAKMTITGYGWAEKPKVQKRIKFLLKLKETPKPDDAADALAIAITYILKREA
ncbi:MAG: crossover junction endodeoxyribonuclease RuvC, partial [Candidatus Nealsonbacteria bacterium]|nr:crossover junction endodeoxyribonuclease RuvC [Candidatus Nealsonbacteria bacterium]